MQKLQQTLVNANVHGEVLTMNCPIDGSVRTMGAWMWVKRIFPWMTTEQAESYLSGVESR